ncbi:hypothetical protein [Streptomyces sp. NPDC053069]|uniref:hypothetical protein n=1 Tax=Streptomyces sp. NPDC053069 TaxID=3365695 RepID=UPI0037D249B5
MPLPLAVTLICVGLMFITLAVINSGHLPRSKASRMRRKVRLTLAFLGALMVIGNVVLLIAPSTNRPLGHKSRSTPSATPSLNVDAALNVLAYHAVAESEWSNCKRTADVPLSAIGYVCGKSDDPGHAKYIAFPTLKSMRAYFDATSNAAPAKRSQCNSIEDYLSGGGHRNIDKPGIHGELACFWRVGEFWIALAYDDYKIAGLAKMNSDQEVADFLNWVLKGIRK